MPQKSIEVAISEECWSGEEPCDEHRHHGTMGEGHGHLYHALVVPWETRPGCAGVRRLASSGIGMVSSKEATR